MKNKGESWTVDSQHTKDSLHRFIDETYAQKKYITFTLTTEKKATEKQFNALHLWCERLAEALNESGNDMRKMLKESIHIPWTKLTVKSELWKPIQIIVCGEESTKDPTPGEYVEIYEILNRHLGEKKGIHVAWPEKDINEKS
jgi:hypothetical protein